MWHSGDLENWCSHRCPSHVLALPAPNAMPVPIVCRIKMSDGMGYLWFEAVSASQFLAMSRLCILMLSIHSDDIFRTSVTWNYHNSCQASASGETCVKWAISVTNVRNRWSDWTSQHLPFSSGLSLISANINSIHLDQPAESWMKVTMPSQFDHSWFDNEPTLGNRNSNDKFPKDIPPS